MAWDDCLPGTAGYERSHAALASDDEKCQSYGLGFGTPAYAECRQNFEAQRAARFNAGAALLMQQNRPAPSAPLTPYVMPQPLNTNCVKNGPFTNCQTY
jgi:hypothetical protein